jgi:hypothetical protein
MNVAMLPVFPWDAAMDRNVRILLATLAIGTALCLLVWAIVAGGFADPGDTGWIYNYQALIAGAFALVGAWFLYKQIQQNWDIENTRRSRKKASLRATGPLAMAAIVEYADESAEPLKSLYRVCSHASSDVVPVNAKPIKPPVLPSDTTSFLAQFIEYSDFGETNIVEDILCETQVQSGRLRRINLELVDARRHVAIRELRSRNAMRTGFAPALWHKAERTRTKIAAMNGISEAARRISSALPP